MSVKLLGSAQSTRTQRVLLVLLELDIKYDLEEISMQKGEHKNPDYVKNIHPFGLIPALQDGETQLFESRAICRYLVSKYGKGSNLLVDNRSSPVEIGKFEQAASVEYSYFEPSINTLAYENIFKRFMGRGDPNVEEVDRATGVLNLVLDYYNNILATSQYIGGDHFTLVDLYHIPWFRFFFVLPLEHQITSRPNLDAWWKRVSDRPSWKTVSASIPH
ncbi:glutathione S-transferase [Ilyonectria sp. MPI-CAGE-AT-0026]|nr:glutathione S-transferase [Ilyonectria sp. MPI-CAGE-AT-0026]